MPSGESLTSRWTADAAGRAVETMAQSRATWQSDHVRAEIERLARADHIPVYRVDAIVDAAAAYALCPAVSVRLGGDPDPIPEPAALRRRDGASVFTVAGAQLFTSQAVRARRRSPKPAY